GVVIGDIIKFTDANNAPQSGIIDGVSATSITVTASSAPGADPNFQFVRSGGLSHTIRAALGYVLDARSIDLDNVTLQGLVRLLADVTGVDPGDFGITSTGTGNSRDIRFKLTLNPDPLT